MRRIVIAGLLACLAPLSRAHADYTLICTPSNGGAPTDVNVRGASGFDDACRAVAAHGAFAGCIDSQGLRGACPAGGGPRPLTLDDIANNAAASTCASYNWQDRGRAPIGYIRGLAMSYGNAVCRVRAGATGATARIAGPLGDPSADALAWYQSKGAAMSNPLRDVYTLAVGLGMRESSGNPTEGPDANAPGTPTAETAEAGLFQTSYNSFTADPVLAELWNAYQATPGACGFNIFMQGSTDRGSAVVGTGPGADFQTFTKQCPAFALDYALVLLRVLRTHFGPINKPVNNPAAEFRPECTAMFVQIENTVTCPQ
jgi:hypothetical protein